MSFTKYFFFYLYHPSSSFSFYIDSTFQAPSAETFFSLFLFFSYISISLISSLFYIFSFFLHIFFSLSLFYSSFFSFHPSYSFTYYTFIFSLFIYTLICRTRPVSFFSWRRIRS